MYEFLDKSNARLFNKVAMAEEIGLHPDTIRKTINGSFACSKLIAYCITKFLDKDAEIKDYFKKKGE